MVGKVDMVKRGNYFIAVYDNLDNNIMNFESIEECAMYFKTNKKNIYDYIYREKNIKDEYRLFKINDIEPSDNLIKSLLESESYGKVR